eukprot:scaffold16517_cov113-Isochrysis_galbana.AAC.3
MCVAACIEGTTALQRGEDCLCGSASTRARAQGGRQTRERERAAQALIEARGIWARRQEKRAKAARGGARRCCCQSSPAVSVSVSVSVSRRAQALEA